MFGNQMIYGTLIIGTFEAMGGLILFGVSTAFLLEVMRRVFQDPIENR